MRKTSIQASIGAIPKCAFGSAILAAVMLADCPAHACSKSHSCTFESSVCPAAAAS